MSTFPSAFSDYGDILKSSDSERGNSDEEVHPALEDEDLGGKKSTNRTISRLRADGNEPLDLLSGIPSRLICMDAISFSVLNLNYNGP